jgi:hypothetical protein
LREREPKWRHVAFAELLVQFNHLFIVA